MARDTPFFSYFSVRAFCQGINKGTVLFVSWDLTALITGAANDEDHE